MAESSEEPESPPSEPPAKVSMAEFLESCPPNQERAINKLFRSESYTSGVSYYLLTPDIHVHCSGDACNGRRIFRCEDELSLRGGRNYFFVTYTCSNCQRFGKTFSIAATRDAKALSGVAFKIGELPPFGQPTPSRLIKLIGPDSDLFLQGRRCENQGLGIGAFVYYRRVVENQKKRILSEILRVAKRVGSDAATISELEAAMNENQFSKAVQGVKHGIPQSLLIKGQVNPLLLLHDALSHSVHEGTDEHCLELATHVRVILVELAERLSEALKDDAELNAAVTKLTAVRKAKP
jgi:hypothetical protein